ncbi:MAG: cysteine desulfurase/selenocysteine lyase [Cyclobacteriaceae bacterium]|jgi:cysteine desulfurase/selenocysteine lyase
MSVKSDFPIFAHHTGRPFHYLDSAATTQKPQRVIDAITRYYSQDCSPPGRSIYPLAQALTQQLIDARRTIADFLNAESDELVFTGGSTDGINKVARSYLQPRLMPGDQILVSGFEHHSNYAPWIHAAKQTGAMVIVETPTEEGGLDIAQFEAKITDRTKFIALATVSNATGYRLPVEALIAVAHDRGIPVLIDAAQSASHEPTDMKKLDADFLVFSSHKHYGPTGLGVLYGKKQFLQDMQPANIGGGGLQNVSGIEVTYPEGHRKHESGIPHMSGILGLAVAIDYLSSLGWENIQSQEKLLMKQLESGLLTMPQVSLLPAQGGRHGLVSFTVEGISHLQIAEQLGELGICMRAGHQCAQPVHQALSLESSCRVSIGCYNDKEDINSFLKGLDQVLLKT